MRRKFSDHDKASIAQQYRDPDVTIASLADQYQVSVSTMQRLLKEAFSPEDYGTVTASKRSRKKNPAAGLDSEPLPLLVEDLRETPVEAPEEVPLQVSVKAPVEASVEAPVEASHEIPLDPPPETPASPMPSPVPLAEDPEPSFGEFLYYPAPPSADLSETSAISLDGDEEETDPEDVDPDLAAALQAEFQDHPIVGDPEADLSDLDDEDEDDDEDDEEDEEEPDSNGGGIDPASEDVSTLEVFNLDELDPPGKCYAVIDRFQELATRPLKDFDHAGILPTSLHQLRTLPLFDNHRVARRFSDVIRRGSSPGYRVIDFPGEWLFMVRMSLWERGITHILFDGHIYDLRIPEMETPEIETPEIETILPIGDPV